MIYKDLASLLSSYRFGKTQGYLTHRFARGIIPLRPKGQSFSSPDPPNFGEPGTANNYQKELLADSY